MTSEIIYGNHPVKETLRAGRRKIRTIYFDRELSPRRRENIATLAVQKHIPIETQPPEKIQAMSRSEHHQGVCASVAPYPLSSTEQMFHSLRRSGRSPFFLVLDNIVDPHNLGALIRTALAVGVHGVITPKDRSAPPTPAVSKASAGALEHILLARVTNLARTLGELKKNGLWIFGLDSRGDQSVFSANITGPIALVVGSEEKGIRPLVKKHCDVLVSIPQSGPLDSLNASVAGAVAMYEVLRQQNRKEHPK